MTSLAQGIEAEHEAKRHFRNPRCCFTRRVRYLRTASTLLSRLRTVSLKGSRRLQVTR